MSSLLRDTWLMFTSQFRVTRRNYVWVVIGLFQPICYVLLFAPLLKNLAGSPGFPSGNTYNVFTPGLMILMTIFGAGFAGFNLIARLLTGVIERLRVTPISRLALVLGVLMMDLLTILVQTSLLVGVSVLLGFRPDVAGVLLVLGLVLLGSIAMASASYSVALIVKDQGALAAVVNTFALPLLLLSGVMLPLSLAPEVLRNIARANPFSYAVEAGRALVVGNFGDATVAQAFIILGVLAVLGLVWATRTIRSAAA
jgi:ABC-2 type transport system permease protein